MKEVSAEFITAITKKRFRKPRGRVIIHYMRSSKYDVSVQHSINNQARHSRNSQCADQYKDATYKYLSLDNKALMDGTYHPFPGTENHVWQAGLWGSILAGESGTFVSNPLITVLFSDRLIRNYHVAFDSKREEYAVNFTVKIYNSDDELIYTDIVENNDSVYYEKILPMNVVINDGKYMTLEIVEWSEPGACVKIVEFFLTYS